MGPGGLFFSFSPPRPGLGPNPTHSLYATPFFAAKILRDPVWGMERVGPWPGVGEVEGENRPSPRPVSGPGWGILTGAWVFRGPAGPVRNTYLIRLPNANPKDDLDNPWDVTSHCKFYPFFRQCIGAIDDSLFPAKDPSKKADLYCCRKGFTAQNIFVPVSADLTFQYVLSG